MTPPITIGSSVLRAVGSLFCAVALLVVTFGCASGSSADRSKGGSDKAKSKSNKDRTPKAPTPDELEDSPCGNPNWAELPEQHQIDGDPETVDDGEQSSPPPTGSSDDEAPEDETESSEESEPSGETDSDREER